MNTYPLHYENFGPERCAGIYHGGVLEYLHGKELIYHFFMANGCNIGLIFNQMSLFDIRISFICCGLAVRKRGGVLKYIRLLFNNTKVNSLKSALSGSFRVQKVAILELHDLVIGAYQKRENIIFYV